MESLFLLCAHAIFAQRPLPKLPNSLYKKLFQLAFLEGRPLDLQDLVSACPLPELNFLQLVGHLELPWDRTSIKCLQAVIQGVVAQLKRLLEKPNCPYSLCVLDMTGLPDSMSSHNLTGIAVWCTTKALAEACVEVSKHQRDLQKRRSKCQSIATWDTAVLQLSGVDIRADLVVDRWSYGILRKALQTGAAGPLCLKCRDFKAEDISASEILTLLESLDRSCMRNMDLRFNNLGWTRLSETLPQLLDFPDLHSLKLHNSNVDVRPLTLELADGFRRHIGPWGVLHSFQELSLGSSQISGNLSQLLCFQAPALKKLDLKGLDVSQGLLEPLRLLLEETSASLLHLDLMECCMINSHLAALLPTLLRCSRLRFLGLHGNSLSTAALKDLLQKILELPDLHLVVYPIPMDCCRLVRLESGFSFVPDEELLAVARAEFSQIIANSRRTDLNWTYNPDGHEALD